MATTDPYSAPRSRVADVPATTEGNFTSDGEAVPAGHGWQWIVAGWELFKRQPGVWILLLIVLVLVSIVIALIPLLGGLINNLLWPVFAAGIMLGCRELDQGGELTVGHLFAGFRDHFGKLVVLGLLELAAMIAIVIVAFAISGAGMGLGVLFGGEAGGQVGARVILLAVLIALALLVPVLMAVWFAPALIVLNDLSVGDALKASFFATLRNIVPFLVYGLIGLGIAIVATIPFGLGWLALGPTLAASVYAAYRDIFYTG